MIYPVDSTIQRLNNQGLNNLVHFLQVDAEENEDMSFFFMSDDALTCDKLMILIHGSGVVRAGQWARRSLM